MGSGECFFTVNCQAPNNFQKDPGMESLVAWPIPDS